jgi:hypothetical protein
MPVFRKYPAFSARKAEVAAATARAIGLRKQKIGKLRRAAARNPFYRGKHVH